MSSVVPFTIELISAPSVNPASVNHPLNSHPVFTGSLSVINDSIVYVAGLSAAFVPPFNS